MTGHRLFSAELSALAHRLGDEHLLDVAEQVGGPLRVRVSGRLGVGRGSTVAALRAAGYTVGYGVGRTSEPEVRVHVLAEACKPEDRQVLTHRPVLVLNKADLLGWEPGGPLSIARRRAAELSATTGAPVWPFVAPLAVAALDVAVLDDDLLAALRTLVGEPADLSSPDAFVGAAHVLPVSARQRMLTTLDIFGIAHAVVALRDTPDCGPAQVRAVFRRVSGFDQVQRALDAAGAAAFYRRVRTAAAELEMCALTTPALAAPVRLFLAASATVSAQMAAAATMLAATGFAHASDTPGDPLHHAVRWQRYAQGPLGLLARAAAEDLSRGALRMHHQADRA